MSIELQSADEEPLQGYGQTDISLTLGDREFIIPVIVAELDDL